MRRWRCVAVALLAALIAPSNPSAQAVAHTSLPTPETAFGFAPCADRTLATYEQIVSYLRTLDAATPRMQMFDIGTTAEGRTQVMAVISSDANMAHLARYKDIARTLALARGLTDTTALALAQEGKAIVWVDFGLHSSELAHGQAAPAFAYRVVSEDSAEMRSIRDNVILLLVPNMNPDGTTRWADWYMKHVGGPYERSAPPELYQKYVGHDNNRDWFMFTQPESRNVARQLYVEWFPQIIHNQHQSAPFPARIFIPPFADPANPNIPALVMRGITAVGDAMRRRFDQEHKPGAIARVQYDAWWNGGMRTAPYFHNMVGILTETGHPWPWPADHDPATFPKTFSNGVATLEPSRFYPNPFRGGPWHFRDSCEYMMTASMAVLDIGAKQRQEWLYDIYRMGRDAMRAGASETYVVPAAQWDPGTAVKMINALRAGGVDVERATAPFAVRGTAYGAGSFVIRGAQPFRPYITDLLNPQVYPDLRLSPGGPPERPYDITGWTLPMQMGVTVDRLDVAVDAATAPVNVASVPPGRVTGIAKASYAFDPRANDTFTAINRLLKAGDHVTRATVPFSAAGRDWPPGTFLVTATGTATHGRVEAITAALGLTAVALDTPPIVAQAPLRVPRIGLYHAWGGNIDEGWTRWVLEQFEFPFTLLHDADVRSGNLRTRFDVIVLPDASYESMLTGLAPGTMPDEYVGGMTAQGVGNLRAFVTAGGTLVALDGASSLPLAAFGLPVENAAADQSPSEFSIPGTVLRLSVDPTHPLAWGMPREASAFFVHSSAFVLGRPQHRREAADDEGAAAPTGLSTAARYASRGLLMSGWLLGEHVVAGRAAVVEADAGKGRAILIGFRTQHRGQPHGTYKFLFNALFRLPADAPATTRPPRRH